MQRNSGSRYTASNEATRNVRAATVLKSIITSENKPQETSELLWLRQETVCALTYIRLQWWAKKLVDSTVVSLNGRPANSDTHTQVHTFICKSELEQRAKCNADWLWDGRLNSAASQVWENLSLEKISAPIVSRTMQGKIKKQQREVPLRKGPFKGSHDPEAADPHVTSCSRKTLNVTEQSGGDDGSVR